MSKELKDISPDWTYTTEIERKIIENLIERAGTSSAIAYFSKHKHELSDYWYWFELGGLWVIDPDRKNLKLWKKLFKADRPNRATSLMKPSELYLFEKLPNQFPIYAASEGEIIGNISYTIDPKVAQRLAKEKKSSKIIEYMGSKKDAIALFLRHNNAEIIFLEPKFILRVLDSKTFQPFSG